MYEDLVKEIFTRFPSVQKDGFMKGAYKPGLEAMREFNAAMGDPAGKLKVIHVAGTNGKGSVANMIASALTEAGYKTGLYTSPHLVDWRERSRINGTMIPKDYAEAFLVKWKPYFTEHNLSFFEITTGLALRWFADEKTDFAVLEVGLGGRLDSTNIVTPVVSVITSIGLDHCALLGNTLEAIAGEKAGIIKPGVPVIIGETRPETQKVFDAKADETGSPIIYAQETTPRLWDRHREILDAMDLRAPVQEKNLRTVLCTLEEISRLRPSDFARNDKADGTPVISTEPNLPVISTEPNLPVISTERSEWRDLIHGIEHTAALMHFHGRWERLQSEPEVIADIGHNAHALRSNFETLEATGRPLFIVYGIMADKDLDAILPLMPRKARYIFVTPDTPRARRADDILERFLDYACGSARNDRRATTAPSVKAGVEMALREAGKDAIIYIGGSAFVVAEALQGTELE